MPTNSRGAYAHAQPVTSHNSCPQLRSSMFCFVFFVFFNVTYCAMWWITQTAALSDLLPHWNEKHMFFFLFFWIWKSKWIHCGFPMCYSIEKPLKILSLFPARCSQMLCFSSAVCSGVLWLAGIFHLPDILRYYRPTGVRRADANSAFPLSGIAEFSQSLIWFVFPLGGVQARCW